MAALIGIVSGEGGPLLIADRVDAERWRGSDAPTDYGQLLTLRRDVAHVEIAGGRRAVAWDMEGAGIAEVFRLGRGRILLQRSWGEDVAPVELSASPREVGSLTVGDRGLVVLWSPVAWDDLWEPPTDVGDEQLSMPSMLNVGLQIDVPPGNYRCEADHQLPGPIRCWITMQ